MQPLKILRKFSGIPAGLLLALALTLPAFAALPAADFSVKAILPENQVDKMQTFFDLRLMPGETQTIQLLVSNSTDAPVTAGVELQAASTSRNGVVVYDRDVRDESLAVSIAEIARVVNPQVTVPASGTATVDVELRMPQEPVRGMILGGLSVSKLQDADAVEEEGISVRNEFVYVVGLKLTQSDDIVPPQLHLRSIEPGLVNYHTALTINLQNSEPALISGMELVAQVYRSGSDEVFREQVFQNANMAPNSNGDFVIYWQNSALEAGEYRLYLKATHGERVWEWDERFSITGAAAGAANSEAVRLDGRGMRWLYWAAPLLLILIAVVFWLGRRSNNRRARGEA